MTQNDLSEEELDTLVSIAIRRAELLEDDASPAARQAWLEVMAYEERLAALSPPDDVAGGIARVGAVRAALAAGDWTNARRLAAEYVADELVPQERRAAIDRAFQEALERVARRFPVLARRGRLAEIQQWRIAASAQPHVFPRAA